MNLNLLRNKISFYSIMRNLLSSIIALLILNFSYAQKSEVKLLKDYDFYIEKNLEMGNWWTKNFLDDGLITMQETYLGNELRSRMEFKYDKRKNLIKKIQTFDVSDVNENDTLNIILTYKDSLLICKEYDNGMTEMYSDFTKFGKPRLLERVEDLDFKFWPYKETYIYDNEGNISKSQVFETYTLNDSIVNQIETTHYEYDGFQNIIKIFREYEPRREFPIIITGGPYLFENEYFKYKYNEVGLWTKKFKIVEGKEYLIAKRIYK